LTKIAEIFAKICYFYHIFLFWELFCHLFYFKRLLKYTVFNLMPHSPSIPNKFFAKIFVFSRKFSYFRENFRENAKIKFSFGPNGKWILTIPHIRLFILLKWDVISKNVTTCTMHAVPLSNLMDFLEIFVRFSRKFSQKRKH
jgi:hypothetical protein